MTSSSSNNWSIQPTKSLSARSSLSSTSKPPSLLFSDVDQFSPRAIVSPKSTRDHTGTTPKVMKFSMFSYVDMFSEKEKEKEKGRDSAGGTRKSEEDEDVVLKRIDIKEIGQIRTFSQQRLSDNNSSSERSSDTRTSGTRGKFDIMSPEVVLVAEDLAMENDEEADDDHPDLGNPQSTEICPYFMKGGCRFRKNCRLSHNIGLDCPYCQEVLPQTWTQQSKHLKRCWENGVEAEELEMSQWLTCELCKKRIIHLDGAGQVIMEAPTLMFCLMSDCQHSLCSLCGERLWDNRKQQIECPSCKDISSVVMIRDRMFFDAERKSKMFGIYKKKLDAKRQKMQQMQGRQSRSSAGYRSSPGSRKNSSSAEPHLNPQSFTAAGSSKQRSISSSQPRKH